MNSSLRPCRKEPTRLPLKAEKGESGRKEGAEKKKKPAAKRSSQQHKVLCRLRRGLKEEEGPSKLEAVSEQEESCLYTGKPILFRPAAKKHPWNESERV